MSKTLDDLRDRLFAAIDGVKSGNIPVDKARAINDLGQTIINTAKVEVDYLRVSAQKQSRFLAPGAPSLPGPAGEAGTPAAPSPGNGILGVRRHLLKDHD
jgi:hypothetical protein